MLQETEGLLVSNDARGSTTTFLARYGVPLGAATGYGAASVVATLSNKALLSSWQFDCVFSLLLLQNVLTVLLLHVASRTRHRNALRLNFAVEPSSWVRLVAPVSVISLLNVLCGLWALKLSSVPIYQTLKRMSPLPAMLLDALCRRKVFSMRVRLAVFTVCAGAFIAGCGDLDRNILGYVLAAASCVLQALYLVLAARADDQLALGAQGLLYYSSLCALPLLIAPALLLGEARQLAEYSHWREPVFLCTLVLTLAIGASLQLLLFLCTLVTSAVTTLIVGNLKAVATTLLGFVLFGQVRLQWFGLMGVGINTLGGIMYSVVKFHESRQCQRSLSGSGSASEASRPVQ